MWKSSLNSEQWGKRLLRLFFMESLDSWGWRRPLEVIWSNISAQAVSSRAACPALYADNFWISPSMRRCHNFIGQPAWSLTGEFFPYIQTVPPVFHFVPLASGPVSLEKSLTHLLYTSPPGIHIHWWNSLLRLFSRLNMHSSVLVLTEEMLQSLHHLYDPWLDFPLCLSHEGQPTTGHSSSGVASFCWVEWKDRLQGPAGSIPPNASQMPPAFATRVLAGLCSVRVHHALQSLFCKVLSCWWFSSIHWYLGLFFPSWRILYLPLFCISYCFMWWALSAPFSCLLRSFCMAAQTFGTSFMERKRIKAVGAFKVGSCHWRGNSPLATGGTSRIWSSVGWGLESFARN